MKISVFECGLLLPICVKDLYVKTGNQWKACVTEQCLWVENGWGGWMTTSCVRFVGLRDGCLSRIYDALMVFEKKLRSMTKK